METFTAQYYVNERGFALGSQILFPAKHDKKFFVDAPLRLFCQ